MIPYSLLRTSKLPWDLSVSQWLVVGAGWWCLTGILENVGPASRGMCFHVFSGSHCKGLNPIDPLKYIEYGFGYVIMRSPYTQYSIYLRLEGNYDSQTFRNTTTSAS